MWLIELFFPELCKSDMSRYGYLEVLSLGVWDNESRLYKYGKRLRCQMIHMNMSSQIITKYSTITSSLISGPKVSDIWPCLLVQPTLSLTADEMTGYITQCKDSGSHMPWTKINDQDQPAQLHGLLRASLFTDNHMLHITKTRLFKYIENFTSKNWKFWDKKLYFSYFCSKHRLWVHVRTTSARWF